MRANILTVLMLAAVAIAQPPVSIVPPPKLELSAERIHAMTLELRFARQLAARESAPWGQRLIAVKVEHRIAMDDGEAATNYIVSLMPVSDETNQPIAWGAVKSKAIRIVTARETKKGDEFDLYPVR